MVMAASRIQFRSVKMTARANSKTTTRMILDLFTVPITLPSPFEPHIVCHCFGELQLGPFPPIRPPLAPGQVHLSLNVDTRMRVYAHTDTEAHLPGLRTPWDLRPEPAWQSGGSGRPSRSRV